MKGEKEQVNFDLPPGHLLLLLDTSDTSCISNTFAKLGTEQLFLLMRQREHSVCVFTTSGHLKLSLSVIRSILKSN